MSWLSERKAQPSPHEAKFHVRRMRDEGFRKPYAKPSPVYAFVRSLFTVPSQFSDFFYMNLREFSNYLVSTYKGAVEAYGEDKVAKIVLASRSSGRLKDTPLIAGLLFSKRENVEELLSLGYPVSKILLYAELAKKKAVPTTWGRMRKTAISNVLNEKGFTWNEFQAIKYRSQFKKLLRLVHPTPRSNDLRSLWGWVVGKIKDPPSDRTAAYSRILALARAGRLDDAVRIAIDYDMSWEVVRSRIGRLEKIQDTLILEAAEKLMTGNDIALQAESLARIVGFDAVARLIRYKTISADAAARAAVGLMDLHSGLAAVFAEKAAVDSMTMQSTLLHWKPERVIMLLDASGSMRKTGARHASMLMMNLWRVANKIYAFNSNLGVFEINAADPLSAARIYMSRVDSGTPLYDSIAETISRENMSRDDLLIVITDEMENVSTSKIDQLCHAAANTNVMIAVVVGYPTPMIAQCGGITSIGVGRSFDMLSQSLAILSLEKNIIDGIVDPEDAEALAQILSS